MELIKKYIKLDNARQEEVFLEEVEEKWRSFHESQAKTIGVLAGRDTGKSKNLILKALHSKRDCIIFIPEGAMINRTIEVATSLNKGLAISNIQNSGRHGLIEFSDGRKIYILAMNGSPGLNVYNFRDKEVMFDEFDYDMVSTFLNIYNWKLEEAERIICVGSFNSRHINHSKSWFRSAEHQIYIDRENDQPQLGMSLDQLKPSLLKKFMEHIPKMDMVM